MPLSGRDEVYIQAYPVAGGKRPVSVESGTEASWSPQGKEIFYRSATHLMATPFDPATGRIGTPAPLFEADDSRFAVEPFRPMYVPMPDGRFLMIANESAGSSDRIEVVLNFAAEVERKLRRR